MPDTSSMRESCAAPTRPTPQPPRTEVPTCLSRLFFTSVSGQPPSVHQTVAGSPGLAFNCKIEFRQTRPNSIVVSAVAQMVLQGKKPNSPPAFRVLQHLPLGTFAVHLDEIDLAAEAIERGSQGPLWDCAIGVGARRRMHG